MACGVRGQLANCIRTTAMSRGGQAVAGEPAVSKPVEPLAGLGEVPRTQAGVEAAGEVRPSPMPGEDVVKPAGLAVPLGGKPSGAKRFLNLSGSGLDAVFLVGEQVDCRERNCVRQPEASRVWKARTGDQNSGSWSAARAFW